MLQLPHFLRRQFSVGTHAQALVGDRPDPDALERSNRMPDSVGHLAHLTGPSFMNRHAQNRCVPFGAPLPQQLDLRGGRSATLDDDASRKAIDVVGIGNAQHLGFVHTLDLVFRVGERGGEIAVICEDEQPLRIEIEPADGIDVFAHTFQEIEDSGPVLGIGSRGDVPSRLVEKEVTVPLRLLDPTFIDANVVDLRICLGTELRDGGAVDLNPSFLDELFCRAPRRDAGGGNDLLKTDVHTEF